MLHNHNKRLSMVVEGSAWQVIQFQKTVGNNPTRMIPFFQLYSTKRGWSCRSTQALTEDFVLICKGRRICAGQVCEG